MLKNIIASPLFLILVVAFLIYAQVLFFDFTYLDDIILIRDHHIFFNDSHNIPRLFLEPDRISPTFYRPLLHLPFFLEAKIGGVKPFIYHLTTLLIHILASYTVFLFFLEFGYKRKPSLWAALIFTAHPVLTQAVAWIPGRTDSLWSLFALFSLLFLLKGFKSKRSYLLLHGFFLILALLTKETALIIPVLALLYIFLFRPQLTRWQELFLYGAVAIPLLGFWLALRWTVLKTIFGVPTASVFQSIITHLPSLLSYIGKIVFPFGLSGLPFLQDLLLYPGLIAATAIIALIIFTIHKSKSEMEQPTNKGQSADELSAEKLETETEKWPATVVPCSFQSGRVIFFYTVWFILFLLPSFVMSTIVHESRIYLSLVGFFGLLLECGFFDYLLSARLALFLPSLLIFILGNITFIYSRVFENRFTFWQHAVDSSPHFPLAHRNLAVMYYLEGQDEMARLHYQQALARNPQEPMVHNNLGLILLRQGKLDQALSEFGAEIAVNPTYDVAYENIALVFYKIGELGKARQAATQALRLNPQNRGAAELLKLLGRE